jgi:hypothetical protein
VISVCLLALLSAQIQNRPISFLSYKDTIFAIRNRNSWSTPTARATEFTSDSVELESLGLDAKRGTYQGSMEGWDPKTQCFNVACEDFDHVMSWLANPRFPRPILPVPKAKEGMRALARTLLMQRNFVNPTVKDVEVYSVDLDGTGKRMRLVAASAKTKGNNPGIVFLVAPSAVHILYSQKDWWPHILTVADLLQDNLMEVIAGGNTPSGKLVGMWRYDHGKLRPLARYESPP